MTDSADLDKMADAIRAAAADCGAMILETTLSAEGIAAVAIDGDAFPDLVNHLKPRLIYLLLTKFDSKEEVSDHFELEDLDPTLKKLAGKWKSRNGQTSRLVVGLVADGVLHGIVETADWFDEFEDELETLSNARADEASAAFDRQQEAERLKREADEKKHLARITRALLADLRFSASKVSAAKRLALAEALFPDEDRTTLKKAVDRAATEAWLAGSDI